MTRVRPPDAAVVRPSIIVEPEPAGIVREAVLNGLRTFNRRHAEAPGFEPLVLSARDGSGRIVGGLVGLTGWKWLHIDLLWVDDVHRGMGVGTDLLRTAEQEAASRGVRHVDLDTFDFQAKPFYEREGYTVFGILEDYPPGHTRYFMRKDLRESDAIGA
jgi:GNAT superfamily N-acetyltransferase